MKTNILGISIDNFSFQEALKNIENLQGGTVITANPELILACRKNGALRAAVNSADLITADGIGDLYAAKILNQPLTERVTGSDLVPALLTQMAKNGQSVFLYGGKPGVAYRAAMELRKTYPGLVVSGTEHGYIQNETPLLETLQEIKPNLLLLGLGTPRQELWMQRNHALLPNTTMIGIGGLLDVFSGDLARAPKKWQEHNIEWLYRLYQEPKRITRMVKLPQILLLSAMERCKNS